MRRFHWSLLALSVLVMQSALASASTLTRAERALICVNALGAETGLVSPDALERSLVRPVPRKQQPQDLSGRSFSLVPLTLPPGLESGAIQVRLARVPLGRLLVKPGHVIVRDPRLVRRLADLFSSHPEEIDRTTGEMVLDVITDPSYQVRRVEIREAHHRFLALYLARPNATIGDLPGDGSLRWLVNGVAPGRPLAEPNKVPVHALPLYTMGKLDVHVSQKAATAKSFANNWDLGSRTSLAFAARASMGEFHNGDYGIVFMDPELSTGKRRALLKSVSERAQRESLVQILIVPSQPCDEATRARIAEEITGYSNLNFYHAPLDREYEWPGGFFRETLRMRLQQLVAHPDVRVLE